MMKATFDQVLSAYEAFIDGQASHTQSHLRAQAHVESMKDWSPLNTLNEVKEWFLKQRETCPMKLQDLPLLECRRWAFDENTGFLGHDSGDFFYVQGLRIHLSDMREVQDGWDQPMITQVGFDGGILGILRKRIEGVPMYLIEAKVEPGNYGLVQMSPTIQATFANIRRSHGGRAPHFADYFTNPGTHNAVVHFDQWLSEDGGRLTKKRNRGMLIEVSEEHEVAPPSDRFRWLSLWQIKECLHEDAWVNPHIRGIIAHL